MSRKDEILAQIAEALLTAEPAPLEFLKEWEEHKKRVKKGKSSTEPLLPTQRVRIAAGSFEFEAVPYRECLEKLFSKIRKSPAKVFEV